MMKKYIFLFSMFLSMVLASCTVSKSVISQDTDLTKYKYVTVIDNDTYRMPPELVQYQIQLYDAVGQSGLTMVSQYRMGDLTQEEQSALLIAKFGVSARQEETVVTVNFIDFNTDRPLVSCQGAYTTLGFSANADIKGALRRVGEQISKTFNRYPSEHFWWKGGGGNRDGSCCQSCAGTSCIYAFSRFGSICGRL